MTDTLVVEPVALDGFACPECGATRSLVTDSRQCVERRRRRRMCPQGHRFSTLELPTATVEELERELGELRGFRELLLRSVMPDPGAVDHAP